MCLFLYVWVIYVTTGWPGALWKEGLGQLGCHPKVSHLWPQRSKGAQMLDTPTQVGKVNPQVSGLWPKELGSPKVF
jgi:hypothetical protein